MTYKPLATFIAACLILVSSTYAADQDARAREALRSLTLRLRAAETERDSLQAAKVQAEQDKKALDEKIADLAKQANTDSDALAASKTELAAREAENAQMKDALQKLQAAQGNAIAVAQKTEAERAKLAAQNIDLQRKLSDREAKNIALFKLGNEILTRYERFSLGEALAAKEPFTGVTRVKLESYVQDYQDKLADQRVRH